MEMKIVGITVAILVSITVLAGVLMPVLDDATATTDTFTNDGIIRMTKLDATASTTITWDHTNPTVVTVGNEDKTMPQDLTIALTIGGTDDYFIRYTNNSVTVFHNSIVLNASVSDGTDMSIVINEGTITATMGEYTDTFTYTDDLFLISDNGEYVMKNMTDKAYVKSDSDIYAYGRTYLTGGINTQCNFNINGTIDDGFTIEPWGTNATLTISDETITDEEVSGYIDLYRFTNIAFTVSDTSSHSTTATYGQVIVPYEVTAEKSVHFTDNQNALLAVIPMLVIVALLIGVVALVIRSRLD